MKPFNLEEYLANPSKKLVTRNGRSVRILCTDRLCGEYSIVALLYGIDEKYNPYEEVASYTANGNYYIDRESDNDLFFVPEKKEGWINIYKNYHTSDIYNSKEDAFNNRAPNYIATMKIEWEE